MFFRKILPPTYFCSAIILQIISHFFLPVFVFHSEIFSVIGILFIIFGIILNLWADKIFKESKTTVKPDGLPMTLVTKGPFKISRNPMYLGMIAILTGNALLWSSLLPFIFIILLFLVINTFFIPMEEIKMKEIFGERYEKYQEEVGRWI